MMSEDEMIAKAKRAYKMGKLRNQKSRVDARRHHLLKLSKRRKVHVPEPFISAEELVRLYPDQFKPMPGSNGNKALFVGDTADDIVTDYIDGRYPDMSADNKVTVWVLYANQVIGVPEGAADVPHRRYKKKRWATSR